MIISAFERTIAFRYLRARREEGMISITALFSLAGIALGVMTLVVVLSVMNGVRQEMIRSIIGLEGHVTLYHHGSGGVSDYERLIHEIATKSGVHAVLPKIEGQVMATSAGASSGAMVAAYRPDDLALKRLLVDHVVDGDLKAWNAGEGIMVGSRMAEKMGLMVGSSLNLIAPEGRATALGMVPRMKAYPVVGIFSVGMYAYDSGLIVMPFDEAQRYFMLGDAAGLLEVTLEHPDDASAFAQQLANTLGSGFRIYDWQRSNAQVLGAVIVQRNVMFMVLLLIIFVACFNIISSLTMLVQEKRRDIAILRSMGMTRASVQRIFMLCGLMIGVVGTSVGTLLGVLIAVNTNEIQMWMERVTGQKILVDGLYFLSHLPAQINPVEVLWVACLSLLLSWLATLYPASRAARMDPAEALRYS